MQFRYCLFLMLFSLVAAFGPADTRAQSIVQVITLPNTSYWNSAYGVAGDTTAIYMASSTSTTTLYNYGRIYKLNSTGQIVDSLDAAGTTFGASQGLAFDGTHLYYLRRYTAVCTVIKSTLGGVIVDSMRFGASRFLGDVTVAGNLVWVTSYSPNPGKMLKVDWTTKTIVDSLTTIGDQPTGVTWDGQYIYYAMDIFSTEPNTNLIYVVNPATGDTVRTIQMPEPPTTDSNPRGLNWDGRYLWLVARPVGGGTGQRLYKYDLGGGGTPGINIPVRFFDYGRIRIGNSQQFTTTIQNIGTASLRVDSVRILYSNQFSTTLVTPVTIPTGGSQNFNITFTPSVYGVDSAQVVIYHNDPSRGPQVIRNIAMGIYPTSYIVVPAAHAFGVRRVGSNCLWTLTIQNQGALPFNVDAISFGGATFRLEPGTLPLTVDSVSSRDVRIWFHPTGATAYADTMRIHSNAGNATTVPIYLTGTGDATPVALGGVMWEGAVPDNPYTSADDYQTRSIKQIEDVNADGVNDVIVASGNYYVMCFNGSSSVTGDLLWTFNTGINNNNSGSVDWEDALQIRGDINGDGVQDVVFGCAGGNEFVYAVSGRTGQTIWAYGDSINFSQGDIMGVRVDRDYNGDGVNDVLVSASGVASFGGRHSAICLNGLNGQVLFTRQLSQNFTYDITTTRLGGAIGAGNDGGPYAVVGFDTTGALLWSYALAGSLNAAWSLKEVPDINNDGIPDIIGLYGFSGGLFALTSDAGIPIWTTSLGTSNNGKIILLDDLNNNGYPDFAVSAPQSLSRLDILNGNTIWSTGLSSSYIRGIDYLSDVNGDAKRDIAIATQQPGRIVVVDGTNGSILFDYLFGTTIAQRGDRVATLQSIDGNLSTEFVGGNREGRVICFSGGQNTSVSVQSHDAGLPREFSVSQNYPNPFNPSTTIEVSIPEQGNLALRIFDVLGREVRSFVQEKAAAGVHKIMWDGTSQRGTPAASGVYFYHARVGEHTAIRRMLLLK